MPLDDRYTDGVWYEMETGDFVTLDRDGEEVIICNEEGDELDRVDFVDFNQMDYTRVEQEAVEDPVSVVERALRMMSRNDVNELAGVPHSFAIELRYARQATEVVEQQ